MVNYTRSAAAIQAARQHEEAKADANFPLSGALELQQCVAGNTAQEWELASVVPGTPTQIKALGGNKNCWEIDGCNYKPGGGIDTGYSSSPRLTPYAICHTHPVHTTYISM